MTARRLPPLRGPKDPGAPALGRVVALPDGGRAVLIAQGHGDTWHGQRYPTGALVTITGTRPDRSGRRPFPVVGHYTDTDADGLTALDGLEVSA